MLKQCDNCEFYNQPDAPFCLDCGKNKVADKDVPNETRRFKFWHSAVFTLVLAAIVMGLRFYISPPGKFESFHSYFYVTVAVAIVMGAVIANTVLGLFAEEKTTPDKPRKFVRSADDKMTLTFLEDEIGDEIRILTEQNNELLGLFQSVDEDEKFEFVETNEADEKLAELVTAKLALRQIQYEEIFLIRLENEVFYYYENLDDLNKYEMDDGDEIIEGSLEELEDWRETPELGEDNSYFDIYELAEKEFLKRSERTQKFCKIVREELAVKRDSLRRGVKSLPQQTQISSVEQSFADYEIGKILSDYQPAFDILQIEYERLKSEGEISRNLLKE